jgi:hypothetical protein
MEKYTYKAHTKKHRLIISCCFNYALITANSTTLIIGNYIQQNKKKNFMLIRRV